jgi:hypothetical protein
MKTSVVCAVGPSMNTLRAELIIFSFQTQFFCNLFQFPATKSTQKSISSTTPWLWKLWNKTLYSSTLHTSILITLNRESHQSVHHNKALFLSQGGDVMLSLVLSFYSPIAAILTSAIIVHKSIWYNIISHPLGFLKVGKNGSNSSYPFHGRLGLSALFQENSLDIKVKLRNFCLLGLCLNIPPWYTQCGTKLYLGFGQWMVVFFWGGGFRV